MPRAFPCFRGPLWSCLAALLVAGCARPSPVPGLPADPIEMSTPTARPTATVTPQPPTPTATSTPTATATPTPVVELVAADAYLTRETAAGRFSGAALVARNGRILLKKGYGLADREGGLPNTPQTRFHIASLTKQFTAMAIMQLQERGKLRVTDRISSHLADCPPAWRDITIEHLLTHTSGLTDYFDLPGLEPLLARPVTPGEIVSLFRGRPLLFRAGGQYSYSNSGYVLLGQIIEQASGESYAHWIEEHILTPIGMANTTNGDAVAHEGWAVGYQRAWRRAPAVDLSIAYAAGGLVSTVEDLYRWDQALYTTQLCTQDSLDALFRSHFSLSENAGVGLGCFIRQISGRRRIGHTGLLYGFSSIHVRYPDEKVTIILLSNLEDADLVADANYIAAQVFKDG